MAFTGIQSPSDISAALTASVEGGGLVLDEKNLSPDFFDLKTGLAGQVLQKFVNYRTKLAVIVRDPASYGARFSELTHEHRIHPTVRFFSAEQPARSGCRRCRRGSVSATGLPGLIQREWSCEQSQPHARANRCRALIASERRMPLPSRAPKVRPRAGSSLIRAMRRHSWGSRSVIDSLC